MGWKLEGCGGRPMKAASAHWSKDGRFVSDEVEFDGEVRQIAVMPQDDGTVVVRAHGPRYAICRTLLPPQDRTAAVGGIS